MSLLQSLGEGGLDIPVVFPSPELAPSPLLGSPPQPGPSWALAPAPLLTRGLLAPWPSGGQGPLWVSNGTIRTRNLP